MKNIEYIQQAYTDMARMLYDTTYEAESSKTFEDMLEILEVVDKLTTNLKRLGETAIIELGDEIDEQPADKHEEDIIVERKEDVDGDSNGGDH